MVECLTWDQGVAGSSLTGGSRFCLIWFFMSQSTFFQLCRDGPSWVEPVLSKDICVLLNDTTQWRRWGWNPRLFGLESSTLPLSHCAPYWRYYVVGLSKTLKLSIGVLLIDERIHFTNLHSEWSKFYGFCPLWERKFIGASQASKIALVRSYLRVPQAAGQVKILIFLV